MVLPPRGHDDAADLPPRGTCRIGTELLNSTHYSTAASSASTIAMRMDLHSWLHSMLTALITTL